MSPAESGKDFEGASRRRLSRLAAHYLPTHFHTAHSSLHIAHYTTSNYLPYTTLHYPTHHCPALSLQVRTAWPPSSTELILT